MVFLGAALVQRLLVDELATEIVATVRSSVCGLPTGVERIVVGGIDEANDWRDALTGCEVVIHLAARVHVMQETTTNPLEEFRRVNVQGTLNLARQAAWKALLLKRGFMQRIARGEHVTAED